MAHEFAIERWDAAAVFLTTRVVLPQMLISASPETQLAPSRNRLTGSLYNWPLMAFSSKPLPFIGHAR